MGLSYTIDQLPDLPSPSQEGDWLVVNRGQNEYRVASVNVVNTGSFVDRVSAQIVSGAKTFANTTTFKGIVIQSGSGININSGMVIMPFTYKTGAYSVTNSDYTIKCDGTFSVKLSGAVPLVGRIINVKNYNSGVITIEPSPFFIDNTIESRSLISGSCLTIQGDGTNWIII